MSETTELMKRPSRYDEITKRRAMEIFMPKIEKYLGGELVVEQGGQSEWSLFTHEKPPLKAGQCVQFVELCV
jgi:hypothetical protein